LFSIGNRFFCDPGRLGVNVWKEHPSYAREKRYSLKNMRSGIDFPESPTETLLKATLVPRNKAYAALSTHQMNSLLGATASRELPAFCRLVGVYAMSGPFLPAVTRP
jgi:hypothetical protein